MMTSVGRLNGVACLCAGLALANSKAHACNLENSRDYLGLKPAAIEERVREAENTGHVSFYEGLLSLSSGSHSKALQDLRDAVANLPNCAAAHAFLGYAITENSRISSFSEDGDERILGGGRLSDHVVEDAIREYQIALTIEPQFTVAHYFWATTLFAKSTDNPLLWPTQDPVPIIHQLREAIRKDPEFEQASAMLGKVLRTYAVTDAYRVTHPIAPVDEMDAAAFREHVDRGRRMICFAEEAEEVFRWAISVHVEQYHEYPEGAHEKLMELMHIQGKITEIREYLDSISEFVPELTLERFRREIAGMNSENDGLLYALDHLHDTMAPLSCAAYR